MRALPTDWKSLRLEEICGFHRGLTYKKTDEVDFSSNAVLRANNVSLESGELDLTEIRYIDDQIRIPAAKKVRNGSLLVCMASGSKKHLGKVALIDKDYEYAFGGFMGLLLPNAIVYPKYLYWITQSKDYSDYIMGLSDGANINNLKFSQLGQYQVSLPPLPEQKRIVAILDEAFAGIATAVANTEKNLANARELFESYLNSVFSQRGEGWEVKRIGEVAEHCLGKMLDKQKNKGTLKPYLRNINVRWFEVDTSDMLQMRIEDHEVSRYSVQKGDLLICEGGYPGRAALWERNEAAFFQKALHRVRCSDPRYNRWILYYLYFQDSVGELRKYFTGAGIQHLTGKALANLPIIWPPVAQLDGLLGGISGWQEEVTRLDGIYTQKLAVLAELKQSLLQKAFSGELTATPQDEIGIALA